MPLHTEKLLSVLVVSLDQVLHITALELFIMLKKIHCLHQAGIILVLICFKLIFIYSTRDLKPGENNNHFPSKT